MLNLNKKGFFLIETLIVVGIAAGVLVLFYKQVSNLYNVYENSLSYDTVQSIHADNNIKKFIIQEGRDDIISLLGSNYYLDITDHAFTDSDYYTSLKAYAKVKKVYITKYNLNPMLDNISAYSFNARYITYLKTLRLIDTSNTNGKYRILIEMDDGTFSNIMLDNSDIIPPVITMNGSSNVTVDLNGAYTDAGATATDNLDANVANNIRIVNTVDITIPGTYTVTYNVTDTAGNKAQTVTRTVNVFEYHNIYSYTGDMQTFFVPYTGTYNVELWGAQGGAAGGGKGAYTKGAISLSRGQGIYIYVGQQLSAANLTSFNGGTATSGGYPGGGATDIRLTSGAWNDILSLRSRMMVAAGGGAANTGAGGYGGQLTGGNGSVATGGSQTTGGVQEGSYGYGNGGFGYGGGGCGGGGGWYGGGGGMCVSGGGGGSSFISGYTGCNAVNAAGIHTNQPNHYSGYVFLNGTMQMTAGNASMTSPTGGTETGHAGNGYAKITYIP